MVAENTPSLPVVGAALRLPELADHLAWLVADQRDLEVQDPSYPGYLDKDWRDEAREGRALLTRAGYAGRLGIHAAFDGLDLATQDKAVRAVVQRRLLESLDFGAELEATHMVIHSPFIYLGHAFVRFSPRAERQHVIDAYHAALEPVLPRAEAMGCVLVIEDCFDKSPYPLLDLVQSFASPIVRLSIDVGHAFVMHQSGGPTPDQWLYEGADLLAHVHLQDNDGMNDRHWAVGDGGINWRTVFNMLRTTGANPRLLLEMNYTPDVMRSAEWLVEHGLAR